MLHFIETHGFECLVGYYAIVSAIGALPAPTAKDSQFYQWFFKFSNTFGGNLTRAWSTAVEGSPNFKAAVDLQNLGQGK